MEAFNVCPIIVSCITPTTEQRGNFNKRIKKIFDQQDYPCKEHIMLYGEGSIGVKRNKCIEHAKGDVILMMDSDDIFASDFISKSLNHLISSKADTVGLSSAYFSNGKNSWLYEYRGGQPYVIGSSMMFWKRVWEKNKFKDTSKGEDTIFCANAGIIKPLNYLEGFIAQIHNSNTESQKAIHLMKPVELPKPLQLLMESF